MGLEIFETITGHSRIDFDKKKIRRAMRKFGAEIRKDARRRVSRRAVSAAGEYPGRDTGELFRSIKSKVSRPGFLVRISPEKTAGMKDFYPAFLFYGVTGRIEPRGNYMTDALESRREFVQAGLRAALQDALVPR